MSKREREKISFILLIILIFDLSTKFFASKNLSENESVVIIKNVFHLTLVKNTGAAFGIFKGFNFFLIIISLVAIILILINFKKIYLNSKYRVSFVLILAGAIGNLVDRLRYGYVVDFLDFRIWPVFNVADTSITIGALLLALSLLKKR